jgi:TRAP-type C4-dicarboxylate transport system permease small subunit
MLLTVAEVIGRYGFNAPIFGRQDIAQILLASSIFLAFPVVTMHGEQIAPPAAFWRDRAIEALTSVTLITMGIWLFERAEKALNRGSTSELLFLPKYPLIGTIAIIVGLSGVLLIIRIILKLVHGSKEQAD